MRLRKNAKVELIKAVPLFSRCTRKELEALAAEADELPLPAGRPLTTQGDRGREFMVLVEGTADVHRDGRRINELGPGDFIGEIALLTGMPRTATVTTTSEALLLVLTDRAFRRVVERMPSVQDRVVAALAARLEADAL
ncbi:MAG TPA: cyclic nucleotide-binding domain-containing protein [Gaiellaceae bacterium]|nr:cyclic nucleotide-binding domain-containing protein [Gaiellaceae bacterium]